MTDKNTIELNGKIYDSTSGKVLATQPAKSKKPSHKASANAGTVHHKTQRPKTLMRSVVKRPRFTQKRLLPAKTLNKSGVKPVLPTKIDKDRVSRAKDVPMSKLVSRFNGLADRATLVKKTAVISVKTAPADNISFHNSAPVNMESIPKDIFMAALSRAESHKEKPLPKAKLHHKAAKKLGVSNKIFAVSSATFSAVLLFAFFAYQNIPNTAFRLAASRAGVQASLPSYKPAGFAKSGQTESAPGQISVKFTSNSDNRSFTVTQRASKWNSSSLLEDYVAINRRNYQSLQVGSKTIYLYGDSNATWVDGNTWFKIEGNSNLSTQQLLSIAKSM